jgi:16S rRNA (guanine527-N7)-methyltransferase
VPAGHRAALEALGVTAPALGPLIRYLDAVVAWNRRINLTGAATAEVRAARLVGAVLPLVPLLEPETLLDVGSGNGSPGLVLAVLRPDLRATLLEPRARRWAFLREAARAVGRPDVRVVRARHDAYPGPPTQNLTLRGLRLPLGDLAELVCPGGQVLVLGRPPETAGPFEPAPPPPGIAGVHRFRRR